MSIFKETFPKFVTKQLDVRGETISSGIDPLTGTSQGNRSDNFYTYTLNKQCMLRLSSGVDITDDTKFPNLKGKAAAAQNVLQGGIQWNDINKKSGGLSKPIPGSSGFDGAYGSTAMRADAKDGYGIIPMPGIIDAQIRTKSAYGSLREGKVKFVCHNKRQLDILETLYMRPGYTLLLEWQWTPYIDNEGNKSNEGHFISDFFDSGKDMPFFEKHIIKQKEISGGNYDALIGYCKNFSYTLREDGGFNCETEIIAKGEIIESLKTLNNNKVSQPFQDSLYPLEETLEGLMNITANDTELNSSIINLLNVEDDSKELSRYIIPKETPIRARGYTGEFKTKFEEAFELAGVTATVPITFINWHGLSTIINNLIPKNLFHIQTYTVENKSSDTPKITPLQYKVSRVNSLPASRLQMKPYNISETKCLTTGLGYPPNPSPIASSHIHMSINPNICLPPLHFNVYFELGEGDTKPQLYRGCPPMAAKLKNIYPNAEVEGAKNSIGNLYLGVPYLLKKLRDYYYDSEGNVNEDFSLYKYIEGIWEGVSKSLPKSEFKLNTDNTPEGNIVRVIEMLPNPKEIPERENIHELNIQSLKSTVRDVTYNTTIPSSLSSTIAIAAQSPDNMDDLDQVSFAAISKGIEDRFHPKTIIDSDIRDLKFQQALDDLTLCSYIPASISMTLDQVSNIVITTQTIGMLTKYSYSLFNPKYYYIEDSVEKEIPKEISSLSNFYKKLEKSIFYLSNSYGSNDPQGGYKRGDLSLSNRRSSSIIPLKVNIKLDGISGLVIGNIFKLPSSRLPIGYGGDDVYFIVMGEEQNISSGQDWSTTISGHLTLLQSKEDNEKLIESWKTPDLTYTSTYNPSTGDVVGPNVDDIRGKDEDIKDEVDENINSPLKDPLNSIRVSAEWASLRKKSDKVYRRHSGIDLLCAVGTKVYAVGEGEVTKVVRPGEEGKSSCGGQVSLRIKSDDLTFYITYCHLSQVNVSKNDKVKHPTIIGLSGGEPNTPGAGNTSGPHLHYTIRIRKDGKYITTGNLFNDIGKEGGPPVGSLYTLESGNIGTSTNFILDSVDPRKYLGGGIEKETHIATENHLETRKSKDGTLLLKDGQFGTMSLYVKVNSDGNLLEKPMANNRVYKHEKLGITEEMAKYRHYYLGAVGGSLNQPIKYKQNYK
mgnify:CR=1 FL=1